MKAKKNARDPSVTPLHGLMVLALTGLLAGLTVSAAQLLRSATGNTELKSGSCVYVVYRDRACLGTVFLEHTASLQEIVRALSPALHYENASRIDIPCGSAVRLSNDMRLLSYESLAGDLILCAGQRIDVNSAQPKDLLPVPGIGPQLANRIVQRRNASGGFRSLEDLRNVPGIGREKLSKIAPFLTVGTAGNRRPALARPDRPSSP